MPAARIHDHDHEHEHESDTAPGFLALVGALLVVVPIFAAASYGVVGTLDALQLFALAAACFVGSALVTYEGA